TRFAAPALTPSRRSSRAFSSEVRPAKTSKEKSQALNQQNLALDVWGEPRGQVFVSVMLTPRISPLELIWTTCLVPLVRRFKLAANPDASTNTSICPPPAVPCRLPKMLRLFSLQFPEMRSPWLVTSLERSNL